MSTEPSAPGDGTGFAQSGPLVAGSLMASLTGKDLATSLAWYRDAVGFTVDQNTGEGMSLAFTSQRHWSHR